MMDNSGKANELCFSCEKAFGKCAWADRGEAVKGWDAEKTASGYHVHACPEWEAERVRSANEIGRDGVISIMEAVLRCAGKEYVAAINRRAELEERIMRSRENAETLEQILEGVNQEIKRAEKFLPSWATRRLRLQALEERAKKEAR